MDLIDAQLFQKDCPYFKNKYGLFLNLITRKDWGFSKVIGYNPLKNSYTSFSIIEAPFNDVILDKNSQIPNFEFSVEDLISDDWVVFSEENIKNIKQEIINA